MLLCHHSERAVATRWQTAPFALDFHERGKVMIGIRYAGTTNNQEQSLSSAEGFSVLSNIRSLLEVLSSTGRASTTITEKGVLSSHACNSTLAIGTLNTTHVVERGSESKRLETVSMLRRRRTTVPENENLFNRDQLV